MKTYFIDPLKNGGESFRVQGFSYAQAAAMAANELFRDSTLKVERVNGHVESKGVFKAEIGEMFYVEKAG